MRDIAQGDADISARLPVTTSDESGENASTGEELASTSDNLSNEAKDLSETGSRFKVTQEQTTTKRQKRKPIKLLVSKRKITSMSMPLETFAITTDDEGDLEYV